MKLPNFRSFTTQARTSVLLALMAVATVAALGFCAVRGYDRQNNVINFNSNEGYGQYRPIMVLALTALTFVISMGAGALGFNSLGQKRNEKPGLSWIGLALSALCVPVALTLYFFWKAFSESIVR